MCGHLQRALKYSAGHKNKHAEKEAETKAKGFLRDMSSGSQARQPRYLQKSMRMRGVRWGKPWVSRAFAPAKSPEPPKLAGQGFESEIEQQLCGYQGFSIHLHSECVGK